MVERKQGELIVDGEYVRLYALGNFPATITTDWWSHLTDGDLPVDVALDIRPRDVGEGKRHLDRREIALATSRATREREVALEQVRVAGDGHGAQPGQTLRRQRLSWPSAPARAPSSSSWTADCDSACATAATRSCSRLRWEQWEGLERVAPLGRLPLPRRTRRVETGALARTTPLSSATMQLEGGVPLGEAGSAPCLFWTRAGQKNAHMAVYGGSGAGKGYLMRLYHSRKAFQHDVSIWAIDSDEQHEYSGRFCQYLHGQAPDDSQRGRRRPGADHPPLARRGVGLEQVLRTRSTGRRS